MYTLFHAMMHYGKRNHISSGKQVSTTSCKNSFCTLLLGFLAAMYPSWSAETSTHKEAPLTE